MVSVGPYMFHSDPPPSSSRSARSRDSASPPQSILNPGHERNPASSIIRHVVGVACITLAALAFNAASSLNPSRTSSRSAIATDAPTDNGRKSSRAAMSKAIVVTASSVSDTCRPGVFAMEQSRFTSERWLTSTPFGAPVEPDVKITYAAASAPRPVPGCTAGLDPIVSRSPTISIIATPGTSGAIFTDPSVSNAATSASARLVRMRPAGCNGSSGT